ncbi:hypothetical protein GIB67_003333 [Kingdonia uniflora]|uniref:Uncharacterized protein n=1 Tax=Kingdonia uniflora TaxID=39325 RepID=A0A7J7P8R5_9MAGN|nr:hypothetical protein GIB67_003333 [Kingdonia uniflora]
MEREILQTGLRSKRADQNRNEYHSAWSQGARGLERQISSNLLWCANLYSFGIVGALAMPK